jgi:ferredoxin-NADP reductase
VISAAPKGGRDLMPTLVLPLREAVQATPRTRLLTIDLDGEPFSFTAGQAVYAGLADSSIRRPYSIASSPSWSRDRRALQLLVQIDDHSAPDPHLERAVTGMALRVEGPFGSFGLPHPLPERRVLFIAGGTGIAPLRSMLGELLRDRQDVDAVLVYSARTHEEFAFREELERLHAQGRIDLRLTVTRDHASAWSGSRGRITADLVRELLQPDTRCLLCGPPALVTDTIALLRDAGVADERIVWEAF